MLDDSMRGHGDLIRSDSGGEARGGLGEWWHGEIGALGRDSAGRESVESGDAGRKSGGGVGAVI